MFNVMPQRVKTYFKGNNEQRKTAGCHYFLIIKNNNNEQKIIVRPTDYETNIQVILQLTSLGKQWKYDLYLRPNLQLARK